MNCSSSRASQIRDANFVRWRTLRRNTENHAVFGENLHNNAASEALLEKTGNCSGVSLEKGHALESRFSYEVHRGIHDEGTG